jgi:RHS repeat-associated protein
MGGSFGEGVTIGRAVWVELASPLAEGESYRVHVEGVVDGAGNALAEPVELAFSGPAVGGEVVVPGAEGGGLVAVVDGLEGLVVVAGVPVKGETVAGSIVVRRGGVEVPGAVSLLGEQAGVWQGRVLVWQPEEARAYGVGEYVVSFSPSLADGAGRPLAGPGSVRFVHRGEGDVVWVEASQVPVRAFSAFGNDHFLHGRPYVASVGLYDHRARFYEARTGTFLEPDPLGPVDSPNLYAAFGFDALSVTDPFGQCQWKDLECWNWVAKDFAFSTAGDLAVGLVDAATLGVATRMVREYQQGNVQTFADSLRVAADAVTNTVTLGARDLYEGGASTWEVVKAVLGISAIQHGAALVGEGIGSGDTELALRGVGEFSGGVGIFAGWAAAATGGAQGLLRAAEAGRIANPIPRRIARVVPADLVDSLVTLGPPGAEDVFVTAAKDIARVRTAHELAHRLTLIDNAGNLRSGPFAVLEFDTPAFGIASPINRDIPGFIGQGKTAGGAREFVIPNLKLSELKNLRIRRVE